MLGTTRAILSGTWGLQGRIWSFLEAPDTLLGTQEPSGPYLAMHGKPCDTRLHPLCLYYLPYSYLKNYLLKKITCWASFISSWWVPPLILLLRNNVPLCVQSLFLHIGDTTETWLTVCSTKLCQQRKCQFQCSYSLCRDDNPVWYIFGATYDYFLPGGQNPPKTKANGEESSGRV